MERAYLVETTLRQLQQSTLIDEIAAVLAATGLDPRCHKLEITGHVAMQDAESTIETLTALKALGIGLAIDDFGTGYSALAYLKRFPVDTLTIDRSFVDGLGHDPEDSAIVRAVVALAKALGLQVTAEGIETVEQLTGLQDLNCDRGQGYYCARPLTVDGVSAMLAAEGAAITCIWPADMRAAA